ncbi:hypothetical protein KKB44_02435 [Candidatus Micrarchaeota archaeon]|nr:hypothetical protein [Candidatus Micrarchaeota archaeon]
MENFQLDADMAELCGIIMGDGNLWTNNRKYEITFTGHKIDDKLYFDDLYSYIDANIKRKPYYRIRGRGRRLTIYSKKFFMFVTITLGIPSGMLKRKSGIPLLIARNPLFLRRFIRGMFDTDGSVFTSKKPGISHYPTLEISNSNFVLLKDIDRALKALGFLSNLRKTSKGGYKISLYGRKMLEKWDSLIGSSNPYKKAKIEHILMYNSNRKNAARLNQVQSGNIFMNKNAAGLI